MTDHMAEMDTLWDYEEKLLKTILELESVKSEARNEMMKNKEYVDHLIQLLKFVIQERDEARLQLQNFLNKSATYENMSTFPLFGFESAVIKQGKANSSVTESETTHNYYSHSSSPPVAPFFDSVTSPEFSNMNLISNNQFVQNLIPTYDMVGPKFDEGSMILDNLARGRVLPQKGKLLQAVLGAGPLLQTLLMGRPLPKWRNPPQLHPFQIPVVSTLTKQAPKVDLLASKQAPSAVPLLNFGNAASGSCLNNGYMPLEKSQKFG